MEIIALIFIWIGVIFCGLGVLGIVRFPDVYARLHAAGEISTLGVGGLLIGAAIIMPQIALKLLALGVFLFVTAPVVTHAIALAARRGRPSLEAIEAREAPPTPTPEAGTD